MGKIEQRSYPVTVDYTKSLADMVGAGKYDYANPNITVANFPIAGTGVVEEEIILVHFDRDIGSDDAVAELNLMGLEPARLEHAMAFGAKYPDVQREYHVVFVGSVWTRSAGDRRVPCLYFWGAGRELDLSWWFGDWARLYRFAAVRPTPPLGSAGHGK